MAKNAVEMVKMMMGVEGWRWKSLSKSVRTQNASEHEHHSREHQDIDEDKPIKDARK